MLSKLKIDLLLLLGYVLAGTLSLVMLFSISPDRLFQQAIFLLIGLGLLLYLGHQDSAVYSALAPYTYILTLILLGSTYIFGTAIRGSLRWIPIGDFQLQTSELAKPLLILALSYFLTRYPVRNFRSLIFSLGYFALPFMMVLLQPDLGTALVLLTIYVFQLFVSGLPWRWVGSGVILFTLAVFLAPHFLAPYQLARLESFIDPGLDPLGSGYNVIQSKIAVGSGGLFGKGLGHGTQSHLRFLPERHTDFMFASLSEELGFFGSVFTLSILLSLIYRIFRVAVESSGQKQLILVGVAGYLFFQTFINIGMNLGIAPVTGVTLPLISYGGSSILGTAIALGIASSLVREHPVATTLEIR